MVGPRWGPSPMEHQSQEWGVHCPSGMEGGGSLAGKALFLFCGSSLVSLGQRLPA